ncbi:MAG: hypothetical protein KIT22_15565, partial [Verrucomicrobiae bacterium]|nr:hypothetical protein [Verrucomicrobiae bacterium]
MRLRHLLLPAVLMGLLVPRMPARDLPPDGLFSRTNLVAWCIVPFDSKKRSPEERAAMLDRLGVKRLAYDWRAEHLPTFDAEIEALQRHGIELTAWWFPAGLNDEARAILACLERHRLHPQLWVTMGTEPEPDSARLAEKIQGAADTLASVCEAAARIGSTVGLYNHLGWFGEPANQVAIIARLRAAGHTNVGCVYNFHHGHDHLDTFAAQLALLKPHLLAVNLNGMVRQGDRVGRKIIPLGTGDEELRLLRELQSSGWWGPVGILGHTDEDAEVKLSKELDGLARLAPLVVGSPITAGVPAISGKEPGSQEEKDWVDNRWQATAVGPFLASNLKLPSGPPIAKGLSLQVGADGLAAVAYDMGNASFRGAWTGGFLKFDSSRFGLLRMPRLASDPWLQLPPSPAWGGARVQVEGWRVHGPRTVLEYRVEEMAVKEMPWAESTPVGVVVIRGFSLGSRPRPFTLRVAPPAPADSQPRITSDSRDTQSSDGRRISRKVSRFTWAQAGRIQVTSLIGNHGGIAGDDQGASVHLGTNAAASQLTVAYWSGPEGDLPAYLEWEERHLEPMDLGPFTQPGPARWAALHTVGQRGSDTDVFAVDTLTMPYDNPWNALMFASGVDLTPEGVAYVSTIHGDVWQVSGVDDTLRNLTWKRFATGLFQPLGLKVRDGVVHVLGRDRITRLHDENGDGEADRYESFFDGIATSTGGHDYVTCLEKDTAGNLYYVDPMGVHRVA